MKSLTHLLLLTALCGVLYLPYLGNLPFFDRGEPREALAVQDIVQRGEWLFPLKHTTAIPSKPPLFHWSAALTAELTGKLDEATIRFPSAFYATLAVILIYLFGRKLFGPAVGLHAGAILATTMIYGNQALSARVDMTLNFFVTVSLIVFYCIYRGFLIHPLWHLLFYVVVGVGTLAKGPLGILLPGLVIAAFLALKREWDVFARFAFHPGAMITLLLVGGWYAIAIIRGGQGFVDHQLLHENLERFVGGSGHSHPVYYYVSYLFTLGLPWSLWLPFVIWDCWKEPFIAHDDLLFLKLWVFVMFVFFSVSIGKRAVYILPLYPAISLLTAVWISRHTEGSIARPLFYRTVAGLAGLTGIIFLVITVGGVWNHEPSWFFSPLAELLKSKDRADLVLVQDALNTFRRAFVGVSLIVAALWLCLGYLLWFGRIRLAVLLIVFISITFTFIERAMVLPVIAAEKSYRDFMQEINRRVQVPDKLYLYGNFTTDPVIYYRAGAIETLEGDAATLVSRVWKSNDYIIMTERSWQELQETRSDRQLPLLKSRGKGSQGDAQLVLVRGIDVQS